MNNGKADPEFNLDLVCEAFAMVRIGSTGIAVPAIAAIEAEEKGGINIHLLSGEIMKFNAVDALEFQRSLEAIRRQIDSARAAQQFSPQMILDPSKLKRPV